MTIILLRFVDPQPERTKTFLHFEPPWYIQGMPNLNFPIFSIIIGKLYLLPSNLDRVSFIISFNFFFSKLILPNSLVDV